MKLTGDATVPGAPASVFDALQDPAMLAECIPGCEKLEAQDDGSYLATVKVGIGAVKGRFQATMTLSDLDPPSAYTMRLEGKSPVGHVRGEARVTLAEGGDVTTVSWSGEGKVSGLIAAVGQRLLTSAANKMARDFFDRVASRAR